MLSLARRVQEIGCGVDPALGFHHLHKARLYSHGFTTFTGTVQAVSMGHGWSFGRNSKRLHAAKETGTCCMMSAAQLVTSIGWYSVRRLPVAEMIIQCENLVTQD